jgi:hypothetical protein
MKAAPKADSRAAQLVESSAELKAVLTAALTAAKMVN